MMTENTINVPLLPWSGGKPQQCYDNVQRRIAAHGGKAIYGWIIARGPKRWIRHKQKAKAIRPALVIDYVHHVVWQDDQGKLWDVTPMAFSVTHPDGSHSSVSTWNASPHSFVVDKDAHFIVDGDYWESLPQRFEPACKEGRTIARLLNNIVNCSLSEASKEISTLKFCLAKKGHTVSEIQVKKQSDKANFVSMLVA